MKQLLTIGLLFLCFVSKAQNHIKGVRDVPPAIKTYDPDIQAYNDSLNNLHYTMFLYHTDQYKYGQFKNLRPFSVLESKYDSMLNLYDDIQAKANKLPSDNIDSAIEILNARLNYYSNEKSNWQGNTENDPTLNALNERIFAIGDKLYDLRQQKVANKLPPQKKVVEPNFEVLKPIADKWNQYKTGRGDCKFDLNLKSMQSFFVSSAHTIKTLEHTLCNWQVYPNNFKESYTWNTKTKEHDIPEFNVWYNYTKKIKGDYETLGIGVTFGINEIITAISFEMQEYDVEDHLIPQLKAAGYVYDKNPSRFANTLERGLLGDPERSDHNFYFLNKANGITVFVKYTGNKYYDVEMFAPTKQTKHAKESKLAGN